MTNAAKNNLRLKDLLDQEREVHVVSERSTVSEVISVIKKKHATSLLVVDEDGNLSGLISEHDVVGAIADNGTDALFDPIDAYMTLDLFVCTPEETVEDALRLMADHKIRHLPVVDLSGHLMGFLSILELLSAYQRMHTPAKKEG
ncbi:MAG: CBS domain-containing protein [Proteobacteria bacterium]|nr:CBS domain-containing protein [Pseudomonadota bacterium]